MDSPSFTETKVIMKLRRQFYNMKDRQDLTGFKVSTLDNGFSRFVMDVSFSSISVCCLQSSSVFCALITHSML